MENRSFDHFLGGLCLDPGYPAATRARRPQGGRGHPGRHGPDGADAPARGQRHVEPAPRLERRRARPSTAGRNDGFVRANPDADSDRGHDLPRARAPALPYGLAAQSTVCDRWFSSVMGPTWPNRFYVHAATSNGQTTNRPMGLDAADTIWDRLAEQLPLRQELLRGRRPLVQRGLPREELLGQRRDGARAHRRASSATPRAATCRHFALIDPDFQVNDGHPPHDLALAEAFLSSVHRALVEQPGVGAHAARRHLRRARRLLRPRARRR